MERCVDFNVRFWHPNTYIIADPSQCAKSHFIAKFLKNVGTMIYQLPKRIVWLYSKLQRNFFEEFADRIEFIEGLPNADLLD